MVAELPVKPTKFGINWSEYASTEAESFPSDGVQFKATIYGDNYDFVEMDPTKSKVTCRSVKLLMYHEIKRRIS